MLRPTNLAKLATTARYVKNHKKPVVESKQYWNTVPTSKPPKYIYEIKYHPNANPGSDMGLPDHEHLNDWDHHSASHFENFRYSYSGQWWEGSSTTKFFILIAPFVMIFLSYVGSKDNSKYRKGDFSNLPTIDILSYKSVIPPELWSKWILK